ncbi:tRNA (guanosine(37)-N1)-methyltransferase TrmD [Candidatus Peregrinibacteria bacterium]|jgi:tRNA (guanine37-N1)-methyltransferase|nr:tRNA (guanosine(37)-N1)-methyltransferase TrmD [Candidatus Peregrinibacteria bacterium]MBT7736819.1 tRNA (guanosine(37)-N1)-methyltransferase TrmD [Candidatus Peregrinibacteria bacterium]
MKFDVLTIFPQSFNSYLSESILKRAQEKNLIEVEVHDIRDFSKDKHRKVDDVPFGGGAGMVMTPQPLHDAITHLKKTNKGPVVFFTPQGKTLSQSKAETFSKKYDQMILVCGRYEGIDQRIRDSLVDIEISIGNFVLTGGELPAMILIDSVSRLIAGVLGKEESHIEDSFSKSLDRKKEYPHYTRPSEFKGMKVPDVLLSGHHKEIEKWRRNKLK